MLKLESAENLPNPEGHMPAACLSDQQVKKMLSLFLGMLRGLVDWKEGAAEAAVQEPGAGEAVA